MENIASYFVQFYREVIMGLPNDQSLEENPVPLQISDFVPLRVPNGGIACLYHTVMQPDTSSQWVLAWYPRTLYAYRNLDDSEDLHYHTFECCLMFQLRENQPLRVSAYGSGRVAIEACNWYTYVTAEHLGETVPPPFSVPNVYLEVNNVPILSDETFFGVLRAFFQRRRVAAN